MSLYNFIKTPLIASLSGGNFRCIIYYFFSYNSSFTLAGRIHVVSLPRLKHPSVKAVYAPDLRTFFSCSDLVLFLDKNGNVTAFNKLPSEFRNIHIFTCACTHVFVCMYICIINGKTNTHFHRNRLCAGSCSSDSVLY